MARVGKDGKIYPTCDEDCAVAGTLMCALDGCVLFGYDEVGALACPVFTPYEGQKWPMDYLDVLHKLVKVIDDAASSAENTVNDLLVPLYENEADRKKAKVMETLYHQLEGKLSDIMNVVCILYKLIEEKQEREKMAEEYGDAEDGEFVAE